VSGEIVRYDPAQAGRKVSPRQSQRPPRRPLPVRVREEGVEQVDAVLKAASECEPGCAEFTDLMTGSLGALLIAQELRIAREVEERLSDQLRW
jgi:hypothetical protein